MLIFLGSPLANYLSGRVTRHFAAEAAARALAEQEASRPPELKDAVELALPLAELSPVVAVLDKQDGKGSATEPGSASSSNSPKQRPSGPGGLGVDVP